MCDPVSLTMLAVSVAGALAQNSAQNNAIETQQEAANNNTREGYRVAQENERAAQAQAMEQQTDRMREATRQLSMARVVAAEGGGSLAARAINIAAAADEDSSRIDASLKNQTASVRDQMGALQVGSADAAKQAVAAGKVNQVQTIGSIAQAAGNAYVSYDNRATQKKLAEKYASSYELKKG